MTSNRMREVNEWLAKRQVDVTTKNPMRDDLQKWLDERIDIVANDALWRCRAGDLTDLTFRMMLANTCIWTAAQCIALGSYADDELFVKSFHGCIQKARRDLQAEKKRRRKKGRLRSAA
jgi:hypothetical protein